MGTSLSSSRIFFKGSRPVMLGIPMSMKLKGDLIALEFLDCFGTVFRFNDIVVAE